MHMRMNLMLLPFQTDVNRINTYYDGAFIQKPVQVTRTIITFNDI